MNIIETNYKIKINNLINEIRDISDNETFHKKETLLVGYIIDAVHAIADCYERNKDKLSGDDKEFILAFRYLNNQLKHDKALKAFSLQIYSAILPSYFPLRLGATSQSIIWENFNDNGFPKADGKRAHYDKYLNKKDVEETLSKAKRILDTIVKD